MKQRNEAGRGFCLAGAFALIALTAAAQRVDVPLKVKTPTMFVDTNALQGVCVAGNLEEKTGSLMSLAAPPLAPGVYRVHMRLMISHTCVQATARMAFDLRVNAPDGELAKRALTILDFERARRYQDLTFPLRITRATKGATVSADWHWEQTLDPAASKRKLNDMAMPTLTNMEENLKEASSSAMRPDAVKLERSLSEFPYHLACDGVWLERVGEADLAEVWLDKSRYAPAETAHLRGQVINCAGVPRMWTVQAERFDELDSAGVVATTNVSVGAGGMAQFTFALPVGERLWGHDIRCTVRDATQGVVAASSSPFAVHTNLWAVMLGCHTMDHTDYRVGLISSSPRRGEGDESYREATQIEFVFWAPDDFGNLTPTNHYWSGQMRRENGPESTRQLVSWFHSRGVGCAVYTKICTAGGTAGYELLRRHPEWLTADYFDMSQLDRWDRSRSLSCWPTLNVNTNSDEAYRHHAREIIASQKAFGWDAVRYDSSMDNASAPRQFKIVKDMVNAACPGFQWGYNSGSPDGYAPGMWDLMCAGGGLIMEEHNVHAMKDGWSYDKYAGRQVIWRGWANSNGGHLTFCPFEAEFLNDAVYQQVVTLCARAHHGWDPTGGRILGGDYKKFCLRNAGQLWDLNYTAPTNAAAFVDWGSATNALFLWDRYVYVRSTGPERGELLLNMVNRPPLTVGRSDTCWVPPPLEAASCRVRLPAGVKAGSVICMSAEQEPERLQLPTRQEGNVLIFTVPKLRFWNMILVNFTGKGEWL